MNNRCIDLFLLPKGHVCSERIQGTRQSQCIRTTEVFGAEWYLTFHVVSAIIMNLIPGGSSRTGRASVLIQVPVAPAPERIL